MRKLRRRCAASYTPPPDAHRSLPRCRGGVSACPFGLGVPATMTLAPKVHLPKPRRIRSTPICRSRRVSPGSWIVAPQLRLDRRRQAVDAQLLGQR